MRKFKFKAWSKDEKRMLINVSLLDGFPCIRENGKLVCYGNCEIMQCTGLKDKSGREIYEGDIIVDNSGEKYVCEWGEPEAGFYLYQLSSARTFYFCNFEENELKIVGNIHENPELLKEG